VVAEICIKMHTLCGELECTREFVAAAAMQTRGNLLGRPWCMAQNADPFGGGDHTLHLLSAHSPRPRAVHAGNVCSADGAHGRPPGT
jgi:hypothetical protein